MTLKIANEIQAEQDHGREKYGSGPDDFAKDDANTVDDWFHCIEDHNRRALVATPMERRQHLIKLAGLAVSAIETIDRTYG
jgi:hypothetical protein